MQDFDINQPLWVSAGWARDKVQDAWIGQTINDSYVSQLIRFGTQGAHSHSMMFRRNSKCTGVDTIDLLELRQGDGGRVKPLAYHLRQKSRIDVFSTNADNRWPDFDPTGAVGAMRMLTAYDYGWCGIFRMLLRRVPLLWRLYPPTTDDRLPQAILGDPIRQPFCSHAVSLATHLGGGVDPVPRRPHYLTAPTHLTESLFYDYEFSIATEWCVRKYGTVIADLVACNEHNFVCNSREEE